MSEKKSRVREMCKSYENFLKPINEKRNSKTEFADKEDNKIVLATHKEKEIFTKFGVKVSENEDEKKLKLVQKTLSTWKRIPISKVLACPSQTFRFLHNPIFKNLSEIVSEYDPLAIDHFHGKGHSFEILGYMKNLECRYTEEIRNVFIVNTELNHTIMGIVVDWMIQVQSYLRLQQETLHIALGLSYRYLSFKKITVKHLQLTFVAGLWIASKFYERYPCEMKKLVVLTDNAYTCNELMSMERDMLCTLRFDLAVPDVEIFLYRCMSYSGNANVEVDHLSHYILDSVLPYPGYFNMPPSLLAAAAVYLSRKILYPNSESEAVKIYQYTREQITPAVQSLVRILETAASSDLQAARKKYKSKSRYGCISKHPALDSVKISEYKS